MHEGSLPRSEIRSRRRHRARAALRIVPTRVPIDEYGFIDLDAPTLRVELVKGKYRTVRWRVWCEEAMELITARPTKVARPTTAPFSG